VDTTLAAPAEAAPGTEAIETPVKTQQPAAEGTPPPAAEGTPPSEPEGALAPTPAPGTETTGPMPVDCSDMQRLSFERVFNKSIAESQRCQAACVTEDCKHECESQHENVRGPQIMERFHTDACSPIWYP
jgi:hypothetical protein